LARKTDRDAQSAALRADALLKAAVRRIEAEGAPASLEDHARRLSGAPPARGDKRS